MPGRWGAAGRSTGGLAGLWVALAVGVACDPPEPVEGARLLVTLDTHRLCDTSAVVEVRLRASWQACPADERDCEPPPRTVIEGDRYTCPATDATHRLGVMLTHPGRYRVEAVAVLATGERAPECFLDPMTGEARIELSSERLGQQAPVVLDEHEPCPP
jgi:hypothetical protein